VYKVGGIGTVLEGLINSSPYRDSVGRTVLVCPLFYPERTDRLGRDGTIEYSSLDLVWDSPLADAFRQIEHEYNVRLAYGQRPVEDLASGRRTRCEVLLVDLRGIRPEKVNALKAQLWERYGLPSDRYEHIWEYEQYVELAAPATAALEALHLGNEAQPAAVFAHEFMGVPTALALALHQPRRYRTLFYAHEVAPIRRIVEKHPGHDVVFYSVLEIARKSGLFLEDVFGPQDEYFKHAIVMAARHCDGILAVGPHVVRELQFVDESFADADITLAYNGVPSQKISIADRRASQARLRSYLEGLLGWRPDLVFTHVTRLAKSKALWRDLDVLEALDPELERRGLKAVLLTLSTELPRRSAEDVLRMEAEWDWPLSHREGEPDLTTNEAEYYRRVQACNARARAVRVLYVNQFGLDRQTAGRRVPAGFEFMDVRRGTDVEFGLSLYEPFGISPLEPLTFGGICVISQSCGCSGFVEQIAGGDDLPNVVLADYTHSGVQPRTIREAMAVDAEYRQRVERAVAARIAREILERLPKSADDERALLRSGYNLARSMSWDAVARRLVLPAVQKASTAIAYPRVAS